MDAPLKIRMPGFAFVLLRFQSLTPLSFLLDSQLFQTRKNGRFLLLLLLFFLTNKSYLDYFTYTTGAESICMHFLSLGVVELQCFGN